MMKMAVFSEKQPVETREEMWVEASLMSRGERPKLVLLALTLMISALVLYAPAMRNGFVSLDDPDYVTRNERVQQGLNLANVKWAFGTVNPVSN